MLSVDLPHDGATDYEKRLLSFHEKIHPTKSRRVQAYKHFIILGIVQKQLMLVV